jgi:hypothetical protein
MYRRRAHRTSGIYVSVWAYLGGDWPGDGGESPAGVGFVRWVTPGGGRSLVVLGPLGLPLSNLHRMFVFMVLMAKYYGTVPFG